MGTRGPYQKRPESLAAAVKAYQNGDDDCDTIRKTAEAYGVAPSTLSDHVKRLAGQLQVAPQLQRLAGHAAAPARPSSVQAGLQSHPLSSGGGRARFIARLAAHAAVPGGIAVNQAAHHTQQQQQADGPAAMQPGQPPQPGRSLDDDQPWPSPAAAAAGADGGQPGTAAADPVGASPQQPTPATPTAEPQPKMTGRALSNAQD